MRDLKKDRCGEDMSELMSLALDGLLDGKSQERLDAHLAAYPECRQEWEALQRVSSLLASSTSKGPPLGFSARVERRLMTESRNRRRVFRGFAVLGGSLALAGMTLAVLAAIGLNVALWRWLSTQPAVQQESGPISQVATGLGLLGKTASVFLTDVVGRYGLPVALAAGLGLVLLAGLWAWLLHRRAGKSHRNGYA